MSAPASDWGFKSRTGVWINVSVQVILLLAILVVFNIIVRRNNVRWDLTSRRTFTLTTETRDVLDRLSYDVEIWLVSTQYGLQVDKSLPTAFQRTIEVLREFDLRSDRVTFHVVQETDNTELTRMSHIWEAVSANTIYIQAKLADAKTNKRSISLFQLFDGNPGTGELVSYRGQGILTAAIAQLGAGKKRVVYEFVGHREAFTLSHRAMAYLKEYLSTLEAMEFRPLNSNETSVVPEDADLVMLLGPNQPLRAEEIAMLRDYLERGGRLFIALQPRAKANLDTLLEEYGVRVGDNVVHDPRASAPGKPTFLSLRDFNSHEINRGMANSTLYMWESCTVDPIDPGDPEAFTITPLLRTGRSAWGETSPPSAQERPRRDPGEPTGPLSLMVAVERRLKGKDEAARLIVTGSVVSLTTPVMQVSDLQVNYAVNQFRWLLDRKSMVIDEGTRSIKPLDANNRDLWVIGGVTLAGFPGLAVVIGIVVWFLRRK